MRKLLVGVGFWLIAGCVETTLESQNTGSPVQEYPTPLVRERQLVVIGGDTETWELRWKAAPTPACEPSDVSLTCPCTGFAYGEGGDLTLVRIWKGEEIDHLELTPLFKDADVNLGNIATPAFGSRIMTQTSPPPKRTILTMWSLDGRL